MRNIRAQQGPDQAGRALRIDDLRRRVSGSPRCGAAGFRYRSRASVSLGFIHAGSPPSWDLFRSNFSQLRKNHDGVLIAERANGSQLCCERGREQSLAAAFRPRGDERLTILADPNAAGFYERNGAVRIAEAPLGRCARPPAA